jgi:hypothetical protein
LYLPEIRVVTLNDENENKTKKHSLSSSSR